MKLSELETATACIQQIHPGMLDYDEWLAVGMALKDAGGSVSQWDAWSRADAKRYRAGECEKKWRGFNGSGLGKPVGIGTLVKLCQDQGGTPPGKDTDPGHELAWDATIGPAAGEAPKNSLQVVRPEWVQDTAKLEEPGDDWNPCNQLKAYLQALFDMDEKVGYVTDAWESDPDGDGKTKWLPKSGCYDRTAGKLYEALVKAAPSGDIGKVIGDYLPHVGAWIRFNPLDGNGVNDSNITAFRFALVESDGMPVERQLALYQSLELPCAAMVHSGGKSIHAIVRIDAPDFKEYQKRVDFLYEVCKKNGLVIDRKNRNPSRLSRLPGVVRNGKKQYIVALHCGKPSWTEWAEWVAAINDDLPEVENAAGFIANPPPLADPLIAGVLRKGHKMLLSGPSKAAKSFALLRLCVCMAEGLEWMTWKVEQGRVMYVNLELDRASAYHRIADVYKELGIKPKNAGNIDVWNLRGRSMPLNELAPRLIRRAMKQRYSCIIVDPIYKVITGDENAADEMAKFCNLFDRICHELGAALVCCHHHSKGEQGHKRAGDRASGSGVFLRDPDALVDMIELELSEARRSTIANRWGCDALAACLDSNAPGWREEVPDDDVLVLKKLAAWAADKLGAETVDCLVEEANTAAEKCTGWRLEGVLREFPAFKPHRVFFRYPIHIADKHGLLDDALAAGEEPPRRSRQDANAARGIESTVAAMEAYQAARTDGGELPPTLEAVAAIMPPAKGGEPGITTKAARTRLKQAGLHVVNGRVYDELPPAESEDAEITANN